MFLNKPEEIIYLHDFDYKDLGITIIKQNNEIIKIKGFWISKTFNFQEILEFRNNLLKNLITNYKMNKLFMRIFWKKLPLRHVQLLIYAITQIIRDGPTYFDQVYSSEKRLAIDLADYVVPSVNDMIVHMEQLNSIINK